VAATEECRRNFGAVRTDPAILSYYERIAGAILPFLRDRPLVLREPGKKRFTRQAPADTPDYVQAAGISTVLPVSGDLSTTSSTSTASGIQRASSAGGRIEIHAPADSTSSRPRVRSS
jgi:DNA primase